MTKDEFEYKYALASGITVEELHRLRKQGIPCHCGDKMCEGWQIKSIDDLKKICPKCKSDVIGSTVTYPVITHSFHCMECRHEWE